MRRGATRLRLDLGRLVALMLLAVLCTVGTVVISLPALLSSHYVRAQISRFAERKLHDELGLDARVSFQGLVWPLGLLLTDIELASTDPGIPFAHVHEARVTLRPFALLSGNLVLDTIEVDGVAVNARMTDGELVNLPKLKPTSREPSKEPSRYPPFRVFSLTGARLRLALDHAPKPGEAADNVPSAPVDPQWVELHDVDVDVDVRGTDHWTYEVRLRRAGGLVRTARLARNNPVLPDRFESTTPPWAERTVVDDDVLCDAVLNASFTDGDAQRQLDVRRFELDLRLDNDQEPGTEPRCDDPAFPTSRRLHVGLERWTLDLPVESKPQASAGQGPKPPPPKSPRLQSAPTGAELVLRAPLALLYRYVKLDPLEGWIDLDIDVATAIDFEDPLPGILRAKASGKLEGHGLRFDQFRFGERMVMAVDLSPPLVVRSKRTSFAYGEGLVELTDLEVRLAPAPLAKKRLPFKTNLSIEGLTLPGLMRELGVHRAAHVRWDVRHGRAKLEGFLDPLMIDGDLNIDSQGFEVASHPVEADVPGHIFGLAPRTGGTAEIQTHVELREDHLGFEAVHARFGAAGTSTLDARVFLGFHDRLEVTGRTTHFDLADASPLVNFELAGTGGFEAEVVGSYGDPQGKGVFSFANFRFDAFELGDVEHGEVAFRGTEIDFDNVKAKKGDSRYTLSSMHVDLGRPAGSQLDAMAQSANMSLDDLYAIFGMTGDPRWEDIKGHLGFEARARMIAGGPEDTCDSGRLELAVSGKVLALDFLGERWNGGGGEVDLVWHDFDGGGLGMELDVRGATLKKKGGGTAIVSGKMSRGGVLDLRATASGIEIGSLAMVPQTTMQVAGTMDSSLRISGTVDTMAVEGDVHVSTVHVADQAFGPSHFSLRRIPLPSIRPSPAPDARGCYLPTPPTPIEMGRYTGDWLLNGEALGGTVKFADFRISDELNRVASGKVQVHKLNLAPLLLLRPVSAEAALSGHIDNASSTASAWAGSLSFDMDLARFPLASWWDAEGKISGLRLQASRGELGFHTGDRPASVTFGPLGAALSPTTLIMNFGEVPTKVQVGAELRRDPTHPEISPALDAYLDVPSMPLARVEELLPKLVDRAEGTAHARVKLTGTLASPTWDGELGVRDGALALHGLTMPLVGVDALVRIEPRRGIVIERFRGELGGGLLQLSGGASLIGFTIGRVDVHALARGVHLRQGDGLSTTFDANLQVRWAAAEPFAPYIPASVEGTVDILDFLYQAPVKLFEVGSIQTAPRTQVDAYDPTRTSVLFDVQVRAKQGFRARNNLVDAILLIGPSGLRVTGDDQRYGLVGELRVGSTGRFKFRSHEFEIREGTIKFEDETRILPWIDVTATTEVRRVGTTGSSTEWRVRAHAYGTSNDLKLELTSEPGLPQDDIILLLTLGMTRAEAAQLGSAAVSEAGLGVLASVTGVDQTLRQAIPVIDDIRFGSAYSLRTGRTEPRVTLGKRISDAVRASVTSGFGERREVQANVEWKLSRPLSVMGAFDNVNDVSSRSLGNIGLDIRYRLEFE